MEVLQDALGQTSCLENLGDPLSNGRRLWRRLEDNGVAGEDSRDEGVDESEVGIL